MVSAATSLPDVVNETSGAELAPLARPVHLRSQGDSQPALPKSCVLYGQAGTGQTVTIPGPVAVKVLRNGWWFPLGLIQDGAATVVIAPNKGTLGRVYLPAGATRIAVVSEAVSTAVAGGEVTFTLEPDLAAGSEVAL